MSGKSFYITSNKGLYEAAKHLKIRILEDKTGKFYHTSANPLGTQINPLMYDGEFWYLYYGTNEEIALEIADYNKNTTHPLFLEKETLDYLSKKDVSLELIIRIRYRHGPREGIPETIYIENIHNLN